MSIHGEALDVILRVQNLRAFVAGMGEASAAVREVGAAGTQTAAASAKAGRGSLGILGLVQKASKATAFALAATAFESYKMGVNFDRQLTQIETQAGASASEVQRIRKYILNAGDLIQSPQKLAEAAYFIESVGQRGTKALNTLHAAAGGAAMGNADVVDTARTLAGIMKVGIPGALGTANGAMAQINATVGAGAMTLGDYNRAMGVGVLPVAKEYGLHLNDINGALAVFADEHMQGSSAMSQLATGFHFLTGSSVKSEKALESVGLTGKRMAEDLRKPHGLLVAVKDLRDHLNFFVPDKSAQVHVMDDILPGGRGRIIRVLMNQIDNYAQKMTQITGTTQNQAEHLAQYHTTAAYKIGRAWNEVERDLIKLYDQFKGPGGDAVLFFIKVLRDLILAITWVVHAITSAIKWFSGLSHVMKIVVAGAISFVISRWVLYRYAAGASVIATQAMAAASAEASAVMGATGLGGTVAMLTTRVAGLLRFAGPLAAFLYGLGIFNPDSAGESQAAINLAKKGYGSTGNPHGPPGSIDAYGMIFSSRAQLNTWKRSHPATVANYGATSLRTPRAHTPDPVPAGGSHVTDLLGALSNAKFTFQMDGRDVTGVVLKRIEDKRARR